MALSREKLAIEGGVPVRSAPLPPMFPGGMAIGDDEKQAVRAARDDMDRIMDLARRRDLKVIEDVAQADGASYHGKRLGTFGDVGAFSLQFHKVITTGEGGVVVTNDRVAYDCSLEPEHNSSTAVES